jgi:hypothetical protein
MEGKGARRSVGPLPAGIMRIFSQLIDFPDPESHRLKICYGIGIA